MARQVNACMFIHLEAPGHGKGFFDGLGGTLKNKMYSMIKATKSSGECIAGTENVYNALQLYFETEYTEAGRRTGKNQIGKFKLFKYVGDDNPVQQTEETFHPLEKINSCYQFVVTNVGLVHSIKRSCWCLKCTSAMITGSLTWNENHKINGCVSSSSGSVSSGNQTTNVYEFEKR
jgi:hypothetical protein